MCFRCARLGHSREDCRQPAVACSRCGGDHSESLHAKSDLTFGQRRALLNDAKGRQNPRAASAIPMSGGGESMPELTGQASGLDIEDHEEDESGAFVTFAPALPVSSVVHDDQSFVDVVGIAGHLHDLRYLDDWSGIDMSMPGLSSLAYDLGGDESGTSVT